MVHQPFFKGDRYAQSRGTSLFNGPFRMRAHCVLHVTFERWKIFEKTVGRSLNSRSENKEGVFFFKEKKCGLLLLVPYCISKIIKFSYDL